MNASSPEARLANHSFINIPKETISKIQPSDGSKLIAFAEITDSDEFQLQLPNSEKFLQACGPEVWSQFQERHRVLRRLAENGRVEALKLLLQHGRKPHVNNRDPEGRTALHRAAHQGHVEVVRLLIENGADVHQATPSQNETVLRSALSEPRSLDPSESQAVIEIVELLLDKHADPNSKWWGQTSAPHYATKFGHDGPARLLLQKKANPAIKDQNWNTPLHSAAFRGHDKVVRALLEHNHVAPVDALNKKGETPL